MIEHSQETLEEFGEIRNKLQLWNRIEDVDPRHQIAACKRANDVDSVREQRNKMRQ